MSDKSRLAAMGAVRAFSRMSALTSALVMFAIGLSAPLRQQIDVDHALYLVLGAKVLGVVGHELFRYRTERVAPMGLNLTPLFLLSLLG